MASRPQLMQSSSLQSPENQTRLEPEHLGDVEQGAAAPEGEVDELGLSASERAEWDAMEEAGRNASATPEADPDPAEPAEPDPANPQAPPIAADDDDDEPAPAPGRTRQPGQTVSRHKYQRDLTRREQEVQTLTQQLNQERIDRAKLSERLTILNEALTAPPPVDPATAQQQAMAENPWLEPTVDVNADALQAIAQMQRRQEYNNRVQSQQSEVMQETQEEGDLKNAFQNDIRRFSAMPADQNPESQHFGDAYGFIKNARLTEIAISLFDKDPNDPNETFTQPELNKIIQDFNAEERWVVTNAIEKNKSPAAAIVRLAKIRGWQIPKAAAPAPAGGAQPRRAAPAENGGAAPAPARPAPQPRQQAPGAAPTAVDRLNSEIEGAAAARSLSDGGGSPPMEPLDAARLLKMSDEEFGAYVDRLPKHQLDSLMGKEPERVQY